MTATIGETRRHDRECACGDCQPAQMHVIKHLNAAAGDSRFSWDPGNPEEVNHARNHFAALRRSGHLMYKIEEGGGRTQLQEFDPHARTVLAVPALQGG